MTLQERTHSWYYDSCEFELPDSSSDYDVATNQSTTAFSNVGVATDVTIRTDRTIGFKINSASNATITITSTEGSLNYSAIRTSNLFITNNSGATASIKILMTGRKA